MRWFFSMDETWVHQLTPELKQQPEKWEEVGYCTSGWCTSAHRCFGNGKIKWFEVQVVETFTQITRFDSYWLLFYSQGHLVSQKLT